MKESKRFHYAYVIFAISFLMIFTVYGFCSSIKSLYLAPVTADTGLPRSMFALNDCCRYVFAAILNMFFGRIIARHSARKLVALGFAALTASQLIYSFSSTALGFCVGGCFLGIGLSWTTTSMVGYIVEKWFSTGKGTVMGIVLSANGIASAIASQILSPIIYSRADGWRKSYFITAILVASVGIAATLLIRTQPSDKNLEPLSLGGKTAAKKKNSWEGLSDTEIFKKPYFYVACFCCMAFGMCLQTYYGSHSAFFRDIGIDAAVIANVVSIYHIVLFAAKLLTGAAFDRFGIRVVLTFAGVSGSLALLLLSGTTSSTGAYVFSVLGGIGIPIETVMLPLLTMEVFGQKAYARMMGIIVSMVQTGFCIGSLGTNAFYDCYGTYRPFYRFVAALFLMAVILIQYVISAAHKDRAKLEGQKI